MATRKFGEAERATPGVACRQKSDRRMTLGDAATRDLNLYLDLFLPERTLSSLEAAETWLAEQGHGEPDILRVVAAWLASTGPSPLKSVAEIRRAAAAYATGGEKVFSAVVDAPPAPVTDRFRMRMAGDITLSDLPDFLIDEILVENSVHAFYGATGAGKTFAAIDMAMCIATGRPWFGRDTLPAAVLWLAAEDSFGVDKRVRAWLEHNKLTAAPFASMDGAVFRLQQQDTLDAIAARADQLLAITGMKRVLIVADTLSKVSGGIDENSGQDLSSVLIAFDKLRHRLPTATICVIHHSGKSEGAGLRGHSSLSQSLDSFALVKKTASGHTIEFEKVKNSELPARIGFSLSGVLVGKYKNGKDIKSCVVEYRDMKPVEVAPLKVSAANQKQLVALATSIRDSGIELPGALTDFVPARGVAVDQWKQDAHNMLHPGAKKKAAYEDWRRARRALNDAGAIRETEHNGDTYAFIVDTS